MRLYLYFPARQIYRLQFRIKNLKANKKGEYHGCIAYIPILGIVETRDILLSNNICDVQRHGYMLNTMQADLYYNRLLKPVKQFSRVEPYIYIFCISVYKLFLS